MSQVWVRLLVAVVVVGLAAPIALSAPAQAKGADSCPEPNDEFQRACLLEAGAEMDGYLFHANDVDAYRFVSLDSSASLNIFLRDAPHPYKIELADWNGKVIASSVDGVLPYFLGYSGAYYIFVWAPGGEFSDEVPYHLSLEVTYHRPGLKPPAVLFSNDFGIGEADGEEQSPDATYIWSGGRFTIAMKRTQTTATARRFVSTGDQRDFVLTFDTRLTNQADQAGIIVVFRHMANTAGARWLTLSLRADTGTLELKKLVNGNTVKEERAEWPGIDKAGGVNRILLDVRERRVWAGVNKDVSLTLDDDDPTAGAISLAAFGRGSIPPRFNFDNVLVTEHP